jgi:hypothetical protein
MQGNCLEAMPIVSPRPLAQEPGRSPILPIEHPPQPQTQVAVIVPVRNEATTLAKTLMALANQRDFQGHPLDPDSYEVIVFANNCTDASAAIARQFARQHPQFHLHVVEQSLPPQEAHIGRVRQLLMNTAHHRLLSLGRPGGIVASTDGDSQVAPHWVAAICHEISQGADAVGGRTVTHRLERAALDEATRRSYLRFVGYRYLIKQLEDYLDPDPFDQAPRHYQFFGANFAVTHTMYAQAGGLPLVTTREDVAFRDALIKVGAKIRHSCLMRVTTSARHQGRARAGLADRLTQFQTLGQRQQPFLVEPLGAIEARLLARHDLRQYWGQLSQGSVLVPSALQPLATRLAIPLAELQTALAQASTWGDLYQRVDQSQQSLGLWQQRWGLVAIEAAIADLRLRLNDLRQG